MEEQAKKIVLKLIEKNKTIASMESCTGGCFVNTITNIEGASEVLHFSAATYSNEFKIKLGVPKETIDKYSVYSIETAKDMSKAISEFSEADYGIGITGKINRADKNNQTGKDNLIFISIYEKENDKFYTSSMNSIDASRKTNKELIVQNILFLLENII